MEFKRPGTGSRAAKNASDTNGTCLHLPKVQDALLNYATAVRVSLYDWQEGDSLSFRNTLKNIEALRRRADSVGSALNIGATILTRKEWIRFVSSVRVLPHHERGKPMKKTARTESNKEMMDEYDFSKGVKGKYAKRYAAGSNVVILSPDVAEVFPDSESVNEALRALVKIARQKTKKISA